MDKKCRKLKVCAQSGYRYEAVPAIRLKGKWLQEYGFDLNTHISVNCEEGKLIITKEI